MQSYEPANTIYDELSSPQLSIPEIVDYPEAAEDDEQQQMQQQQQIQEPQLQNEYLDQLLQNILDASWKDQGQKIFMIAADALWYYILIRIRSRSN